MFHVRPPFPWLYLSPEDVEPTPPGSPIEPSLLSAFIEAAQSYPPQPRPVTGQWPGTLAPIGVGQPLQLRVPVDIPGFAPEALPQAPVGLAGFNADPEAPGWPSPPTEPLPRPDDDEPNVVIQIPADLGGTIVDPPAPTPAPAPSPAPAPPTVPDMLPDPEPEDDAEEPWPLPPDPYPWPVPNPPDPRRDPVEDALDQLAKILETMHRRHVAPRASRPWPSPTVWSDGQTNSGATIPKPTGLDSRFITRTQLPPRPPVPPVIRQPQQRGPVQGPPTNPQKQTPTPTPPQSPKSADPKPPGAERTITREHNGPPGPPPTEPKSPAPPSSEPQQPRPIGPVREPSNPGPADQGPVVVQAPRPQEVPYDIDQHLERIWDVIGVKGVDPLSGVIVPAGGIFTRAGVQMHPQLREPKDGRDYLPDFEPHANGFRGELNLANRIMMRVPGEQVIRYGNKAGANGPDIISVGKDGVITIWDSKWRSRERALTEAGRAHRWQEVADLQEQIMEALVDALREKLIDAATYDKAVDNAKQGNFFIVTVGTGKAYNAVIEEIRHRRSIALKRAMERGFIAGETGSTGGE